MTGEVGGTTTARRALWSVGLLILLAGIFGMHGLSSHAGGMGPETHQMTSAAVVSGAGAHALAVPDVMFTVVRDMAHTPTAVSAALLQDLLVGDLGATAMCMAVLALALTLLLRSLGDVPALRRIRRTTTLAQARVSSGRDPDPPSLIVLSIRRC